MRIPNFMRPTLSSLSKRSDKHSATPLPKLSTGKTSTTKRPEHSTSPQLIRSAKLDKTVPAVVFELFTKLPAELRIQIWKHAVNPRLILLVPYKSEPHYKWRMAYKVEDVNPRFFGDYVLDSDSDNSPLPLLEACIESRQEIAPTYRQMFGLADLALEKVNDWQYRTRFIRSPWSPKHEWLASLQCIEQGILFNPQLDTLMLNEKSVPGSIELLINVTNDMKDLRYIAIYVQEIARPDWDYHTVSTSWLDSARVSQRFHCISRILAACPNLERLYWHFDDRNKWSLGMKDPELAKDKLYSELQKYIDSAISVVQKRIKRDPFGRLPYGFFESCGESEKLGLVAHFSKDLAELKERYKWVVRIYYTKQVIAERGPVLINHK